MRLRDRLPPELIEAPPTELRMFADESRSAIHPATELLGEAVYGDREAWLAARREWELAHGVTVTGWYSALCAEALERARPSLDLFYSMIAGYDVEPDDWTDPRLA